jgi:hypothetical protein
MGCLHHGPRSRRPFLPYNIWLDVNLSHDHFGLHQEEEIKNLRVTMELEAFKRHVLNVELSDVVDQWVLRWERDKRGSLIVKSMKPDREMPFSWFFLFFYRWGGSRGEEEERVKHETKILELSFLGYVKESSHPLFGAWSLLLVHVWFTHSEGPNGFKHFIFKKVDHGSVTMKCDHGKKTFWHGTTSWSMM